MTYDSETINEFALNKRAKESAEYITQEAFADALERTKESNLWDEWQDLIDQLEDFDIGEAAHIEADSWDWAVYNHKALELCSNVWSGSLDRAEESWLDCGGEAKGLYEVACGIAYWLIYHAVSDALESEIAALKELAEGLQEGSKDG